MPPWNGPRAKVQIKLSIQRLRTLQEKKLALAKASRRDIADLLVKQRVETARLRVEGLIQDDIYVELLEVLELYAEVLQARFNLLEASNGQEPEPSISDAVCAIIYAAPRTELKELQVLREILMHKFGRNFSLTLQPSDPPPPSVPKRILSELTLFTPSKELVDAYLGEIAKGYGVNWVPEPPVSAAAPPDYGSEEGAGSDDQGDEGGEGSKEGKERSVDKPQGHKEEQDKAVSKDVVERESATIKAPAVPAAPTVASAPTSSAPTEKEPTEEEQLARRFERLKNLR